MVKQRIGLLMGSFNPIQSAHICIAQQVLNMGIVDCVLFVPTLQNVWKEEKPVPFKDRIHMIELAINSADYLHNCLISTIESHCHKDPNNAYAYETIDAIMQKNKKDDNVIFYLIGGSDVMTSIKDWKNSESILLRPNLKLIEIGRGEAHVPSRADVIYIPSVSINISSTLVRDMAKKGENLYPLVPRAVESFIKENKLYLD